MEGSTSYQEEWTRTIATHAGQIPGTDRNLVIRGALTRVNNQVCGEGKLSIRAIRAIQQYDITGGTSYTGDTGSTTHARSRRYYQQQHEYFEERWDWYLSGKTSDEQTMISQCPQ